MPRASLSSAERKARAERNRMARALGQPTSRENPDAPIPPAAYKPIPGGPLESNEKLLERLKELEPYDGSGYLSEKQIRFLCEIVEIGNFPHHVASALGVPEGVWKGWMEKGKKGEMPYAHLWVRVQKARGTAVITLVNTIRKASDAGNWTAAARMLESFASMDWMRTEKRIEEPGGQYKELLDELVEYRKKRQGGPQPVTVETTVRVEPEKAALPA